MKYHVPTIQNFLGDLMRFFTKKSCYYQGFFAVKRRAVFILGAMWIALVRGWRRDCVVGGMETRFQWRKAHSRTAKCEAFHVAPRLFFMFFVFDYIHDSATMHNPPPANQKKRPFGLSPEIFHWTLERRMVAEKRQRRAQLGACARRWCFGFGSHPTIQEVGFFSIENYTI